LKKFEDIENYYVKIPNDLVNDITISWKAKGLFCHMASKPDTWNFTVRSLATKFPDGKSAIFAALNELKERGWITFNRRANGQGKYKLETSLEPESDNQYEAMPESDNRTEADQPQSDNRTKEREPESDNPDLGYRTLRKSERISNTDALNNKDLSQGRERNSNLKDQQHDYAVIPESSTRYDIPSLINEEIFGE
jgi:DNA-binding transcriptional MocR family regulator